VSLQLWLLGRVAPVSLVAERLVGASSTGGALGTASMTSGAGTILWQ
jgi:hypothetical protein